MRKLILILTVFLSGTIFSQVNWMTLQQAMEAQKVNPKKILIDFYADWCAPCKVMDKSTYGHTEISKYLNDNFYAVKFNAEGNENINIFGRNFGNPDYQANKKRNSMHEFTQFMNVNSVPSVVFLDERSMPITNLNGYLKAKELDPYLKIISTDEYKKFKSRAEWENYQKKLKSDIKD